MAKQTIDKYGVTASTWISVKDVWPEPTQGIILGHNGSYAFECQYDDGAWCNIGGEEIEFWVPLKPPIAQ